MTGQVAPRSAPAAQRNAGPLSLVVADWLSALDGTLLEVGCGTGEHAATLSAETPDLCWLPTDVDPDVATIMAWRAQLQFPTRVAAPAALDVTRKDQWRGYRDLAAVYTVNTLHIMPWPATQALFRYAATACRPGARLLVYGPMHIGGRATSPGNAEFDASLRSRGLGMGIRDLEAIRSEAAGCGWVERAHYAMPANNQALVWQRSAQ